MLEKIIALLNLNYFHDYIFRNILLSQERWEFLQSTWPSHSITWPNYLKRMSSLLRTLPSDENLCRSVIKILASWFPLPLKLNFHHFFFISSLAPGSPNSTNFGTNYHLKFLKIERTIPPEIDWSLEKCRK